MIALHPIRLVADGVRARYGMVPAGWRDYLTQAKSKMVEPLHEESTLDKRINEILDTETKFVQTIEELQNKFLDSIYGVLGGNAGPKGIECLGLSQDEANKIFEQLPAIVRFSKDLLSKLWPIDLVRAAPQDETHRALHVGQGFVEMAPKLHVYAPAVTSYQASLGVLDKAVKKVEAQKNVKYMSFLQVWEHCSDQSEYLKGLSLQGM